MEIKTNKVKSNFGVHLSTLVFLGNIPFVTNKSKALTCPLTEADAAQLFHTLKNAGTRTIYCVTI